MSVCGIRFVTINYNWDVQKVAMCHFWNKLINMKENHSPKRVFHKDAYLTIITSKSWSHDMTSLLSNLHAYVFKEITSIIK